jgi:Immunoglobulin I-set domain
MSDRGGLAKRRGRGIFCSMRGLPRIALLIALAATFLPFSRAADAPAQDGRKNQQILFSEIPEHSAADAPFALTAKATSGLKVEFVLISGPAVLDGSNLRLTGSSGLVIVRAFQTGNAAFLPAKDAERAFNVQAKPSAPRFTEQPVALDASVGGAVLLTVEVSGEPAPTLQWRKNGTPIPEATGRALSIPQSGPNDAGTYDVVATNSSGTAISQRVNLGVEKRSQFISFQVPSGQLQAGQMVTLFANASSGLPVEFEVASGVAVITGSTITAQAGSVTVRATQAGNSEYEAASPVSQTLIFGPVPGHF